jgi:hypothetical protein
MIQEFDAPLGKEWQHPSVNRALIQLGMLVNDREVPRHPASRR